MIKAVGFDFTQRRKGGEVSESSLSVMYEVEFTTEIQAANGAFEVTKRVLLPFVPFPGLVVFPVRHPDDGLKIKSVFWSIDGGYFVVNVELEPALFEWDRDFTSLDAKLFIDYGCCVDGHRSVDDWRQNYDRPMT